MKRVKIQGNNNLNLDKRGWRLIDIEVGSHIYPLKEEDFVGIVTELNLIIDKSLYYCFKDDYLFIIHSSEEAFSWYNTYVVAIHKMDANEMKSALPERKTSLLQVFFNMISFIIAVFAIGLLVLYLLIKMSRL